MSATALLIVFLLAMLCAATIGYLLGSTKPTPIYYDPDFDIWIRRRISDETWACLEGFFEDDDEPTPPQDTEPQSNVVQFPVKVEDEDMSAAAQARSALATSTTEVTA